MEGEERRGGGFGRWVAGAARVLVALAGLACLAAAGGIVVFTQTATGRDVIRGMLESALTGTVNGRVRVGAITGGNLVTRASLASFRIEEADGSPFLALDSVRVEYSPLGFLTGEYHFRRLRAVRVELTLEQDTSGTWNYQRLFGHGPDTTAAPRPDTASGGGTRIVVTDAHVDGGRIEVRQPWAADLRGAARDSAVRDALAGGTIWNVQRGPGGRPVREFVLDSLSGSFPSLRLADPDRPFRLAFSDLTSRVEAVRQPLDVQALTGAADFGDTIDVRLDEVRTASSRISGKGWVVPDSVPIFRFDLDADPLGFADLGWLPVPVPDRGGGPVALVLRSSGPTTVVEAHDGDVRSGDSRLRGSFELHLTDPARFASYDVQVDPLRLSLVDRLLDRPTDVDGLVSGELTGSGPIDLLGMDGTLTLRRPGPSDSAGAPSRVGLHGAMSLTTPRRLGSLRLDFQGFEPRWTRVLGIDTRQPGRLSGTATLDGVIGRRVTFTEDLTQRIPGDTTSHVTGRGSLDMTDTVRVDVSLTTAPLSLSVIDPYFPNVDMVGVVRGPVQARGCLCDLTASADLATPRGHLTFDGSFDLVAERRRYDARLTARGIQLRQWLKGGPRTRLAVRGRVQGEGTDPADLAATFDLEILPSMFAGARVDSSLLRFSVREGLATADTFAIRTDVGRVRGRGAFGLASDKSGSLVLDVDAPDLSAWNRWLVPGRNPAEPDTSAAGLLAEFPGAGDEEGGGEERPASRPDTLAGSLAARGVVYGNLDSYAFGGSVTARSPSYGRVAADSARLTLDVTSAASLDSLVLRGDAWGLERGAVAADSVALRISRRGPREAELAIQARRDTTAALDAAGSVAWGEGRARVDLRSLSLGFGIQRITLQRPATVMWSDSGVAVDSLLLSGTRGGLIRAEGEVPRRGEARFDLAVQHVQLANVASFLHMDPAPSGRLDASFSVRGTGSAPVMDASVRVDSPTVGSHAYTRLEATLHYADRETRVHGQLSGAKGPLVKVSGRVEGDLAPATTGDRFPDRPLDLKLEADSLPLELAAAPFAQLRAVAGTASGTLTVRGGPEAPELGGSLTLAGGAATVPSLGVRFAKIDGPVRFEGTKATLDSLGFVSAAGGGGTLKGTLDLAHPTDPGFDLDLAARKLQAIERRRASATLDGKAHLAGSYSRPTVTGNVRISNGTIRFREFLREQDVVDLTDPEMYALLDTTSLAERRLVAAAQNPFMQNLRMDLSVSVGPDLWMRSQQMAVEISGDIQVRMDRSRGDLTVFGPVQLVRGTYTWTPSGLGGVGELVSRQLRITDGTIAFVGTPGVDPNLDITAEHRIQTSQGPITVTAHVGGTMLQPELSLSSEPSLSQSDQVCVLLFNRPCAATGTYAEGSTSASQLAGEQLLGRFGSELSSLLVGQSPIEYLNVRQGPTTSQTAGAGGETSLFGDTEVEAGVYLGPDVFLTVTYPVGMPLPEGTLSWRFRRSWTLEARMQYRFNQQFARVVSSNLDLDRLYGLFLFRDWSF